MGQTQQVNLFFLFLIEPDFMIKGHTGFFTPTRRLRIVIFQHLIKLEMSILCGRVGVNHPVLKSFFFSVVKLSVALNIFKGPNSGLSTKSFFEITLFFFFGHLL